MAAIALRRHGLELAIRCSLVASVAIYRGVSSGQQKTIGVLLNLLHGNLPSSDGVALFTICSQLPPVNIGVAVLAPLSYVREDGFHMALRAGDRRVHAAEGIFRLVMIELRHRPNRPPSIRSVAVLARYTQVPMRAVS